MNKTTKDILKMLLFLSIGLVILYFVYTKSQTAYLEECQSNNISPEDCSLIDKIISDMKSTKFIWVFVSLLFYMLSNVLRALRWNMLLEPMGYKPRFFNSLGAIMVGYLANLGLPRSGEFIRAGLLSKHEGCEPEKVMGTIVTDRILDFICFFTVIGLALILSYRNLSTYMSENIDLQGKFGFLLNPIFIGASVFVSILLLVYVWRNFDSLKATKVGSKIFTIVLGFWEGVSSIFKLKSPILFIFYSLGIWTCYYLMTYLMFFAFEPTSLLGPVTGLVVFVFGTLGIVIPSPGGMGSYQYLISQALMLYGLSYSDAFSMSNILFFSVTLFCNFLLGLAAFIALPIYNRKS